MHAKMKLWAGLVGGLGILCCIGSPAAWAQPVETLSNYMGKDWTGFWQSEVNWFTVTPYSAEPGDGLGGQIDQISMAHDDTYLYIFFDEGTEFAYEHGSQNIYFDTDLNSATGDTTDFWWWVQSMGGVGAEHSMYGPAIWHHGDAAWTGDSVDNSVSNAGNHLIQIHRAKLGNPTSFDWVARMFGVDDYYPNQGTHHRYVAQPLPMVTAFGREWTVTEPLHRGVGPGEGDVTGAPNSLTLQGVWGADTNAIAPVSVEVGTKVEYDFAVTSDAPDRSGEGPSTWVGDMLGIFSSSSTNPGNSLLLTTRAGILNDHVGSTPGGLREFFRFSDISSGLEGPEIPLAANGVDLADGVHVEWLFTSQTTVDISVSTLDGLTLLGMFTDTLSDITAIQGFRFNAWDTEETLTISNFAVIPPGALAGDYNNDGSVDAADYVEWRDTDSSNPDSYNTWRANFGRTAGSGAGAAQTASSASVPEPSTLALCGLLFALAVAGGARTPL